MPLEKRTVFAAASVVAGAALLGAAYFAMHGASREVGGFSPPPAFSAPIAPEQLSAQYPAIASALADPALGSLLKDVLVAYEQHGPAGAHDVARDRGLLSGNDEIMLVLLTDAPDTKPIEAQLTSMGVRIVGRRDGQVSIAVPWSKIEAQVASGKPPADLFARLAALKDVRGVVPAPVHRKDGRQGAAMPVGGSEGVRVTSAALWQQAGFRGQGVTVGVLDPEVTKASAYVGRALPADAKVFAGECVSPAGASVDDEGLHGVAAAEIVHEMAPDAHVLIACSLGDQDAAVAWLIRNGAKIISFSAGGMYGPRNGQGSEERAIDKLAHDGVLWVNAAGNEGASFHRSMLTGGDDGYWHAFAPGKTTLAFRTKRDGDVRVTAIWSEWQKAFVSDYDLYLFDTRGVLVARSEDRNTFLRQPQETIHAKLAPDTDYYLALRGHGRTQAAPLVLDVHNAGRMQYTTPSGSIEGPADAAGALAVGAVPWKSDHVAAYSSRGPTEDGRVKPDISAPTEVTSLVYGGVFAGTSSATPHVAGAAALVWSRFPSMSRNDVADFLLRHVKDLGAPGADNDYGAGRLDLGPPAASPSTPVAIAPVPIAPRVPPAATATPLPGTAADDDSSSGVGQGLLAFAFGVLGALALTAGLVALRLFPRQRLAAAGAPSYAAALGPNALRVPRAPAPYVARSNEAPLAAYARSSDPPAAYVARPSDAFQPGPVFVAVSGPSTGHVYPLRASETVIGRTPENAVVVPETTVSQHHARVLRVGDVFWIMDGGSTNGTFVNGARVRYQALAPGDIVSVGPAAFRFERRT